MIDLTQSPIGPYAALCIGLWFAAYVVRRFWPKLWIPMTKWPDPEHPVSHLVQALPTAVLGAVVAGASTGQVEEAAWGALTGFVAPIWHHILKATPTPYQGALNDRATKVAKAVKRLGKVSLVLLLVGCAEPPPALSPDEAECLAARKAEIAVKIAACGDNTEGECSTDAIYSDDAKERQKDCVR